MNTALPTFNPIAGLIVGGTVTKNFDGSWTGTLPIGFAYQWQRCKTTDPASCVNIAGATTSSYLLHKQEQNLFIRLAVTATNP